MLYIPTIWIDRQVERPRTYTDVRNQDGSRTDTPAPGQVRQNGTQFSATNMNHIEQGVQDAHIAEALMVIAHMQNVARIEALEKATVQEVGTVTLTNTVNGSALKNFLFNNSQKSVALTNRRDNLNYMVVIVGITGGGNVGEVEVTDRLVNGFKLAYSGSAASVAVTYAVIGGYE